MPRLAQVATARQAKLQDGRRLGFAEYGEPGGAPVLLFHDLWSNHKLRHPDDAIIKRLGIRLIGIDRPGYGASTRHPGRGLMEVVDDVMLLAKALKLDQFAVLGYSAGGPYALACAWRFPQVVKRCAIVASWPPLDHAHGIRALHPVYGRLMQLASGNETLFRLLLRAFFVFDMQRGPEQFLRELGGSLSRTDQAALGNLDLFISRRDMWDEIRQASSEGPADELLSLVRPWGFHLQSIRAPVDVWWGEADPFCAPIVGARMAQMIPKARTHRQTQAGHLLLYTHWEQILQALLLE